MALHPKTPFVALLRLVHLRITRFCGILCGAGGVDDRCVYDGSAFHHVTGLYHDPVDGVAVIDGILLLGMG